MRRARPLAVDHAVVVVRVVRISRVHGTFFWNLYNKTMADTPPVEIRLRRTSRLLQVRFADAGDYALPFEFLRVNSPSAEVQGHGPGQRVLVTGKENVQITAVEPVGHYAVRLVFDDGHDSGLYTWKYLRELGAQLDAEKRKGRA
jgi:DUF971 family protein